MTGISTDIEAGSPADRVCRWFGMSSNRTEERSAAELARQFNCATPKMMDKGLEPAINAQLLEQRRGDVGMVYVAGPRLAGWIAGQAAPATKLAKDSKPRKARVLLPDLDLGQVTVRADIPVPKRQVMEKGRTRWDDLLDKLDKPGMSIELPGSYGPALSKATQVYGARLARKFAVRQLAGGKCGIWRTE